MDSEMVAKCVEESKSSGDSVLNLETVYELPNKIGNALDSPTKHVVSERVQSLASEIYTELQRIINRCGDDEAVVAGLMPLVVNVLESLDLAIIEKQQLQVELELCKDDNEQLVNAFDNEKQNKKKTEAKLIEYEFQTDEEKQQYQQKVDSLESIVKILELKAKNSSDHAARLEEKENEMKLEYHKLHDRYNELLRSHCDLMERMKILMGNEEATGVSGPLSLTSNINFKALLNKRNELDSLPAITEMSSENNNTRTSMQKWDPEMSLEDGSIIEEVDETTPERLSQTFTGENVNSSDTSVTVADNFFAGMEKEIINLITENNELLATKNALNIVKDDLIAKVDELQNELSMSKDETQQLTAVKNKLKSRIQSLDEEMRILKEELEESKQKIAQLSENDEDAVPIAQRKRFTRIEMAKVLMERNQYKQRLIELQDAVRWTELIRRSKNEEEKKSAVWKLFSKLFSSPTSSSSQPTSKETPAKSPTKSPTSPSKTTSPKKTVTFEDPPATS